MANQVTSKGYSFFQILSFVISFILLLTYFFCHEIPAWNKYSVTESLSRKLVGQDLAIQLVVDSLTDYVTASKTKSNRKPLVLSFHGGTGVGKTYLASLLHNYFPKYTQFSVFSFFHHYNLNSAEENKNKILNWVQESISPCDWNIFVLDDFNDKGSVQQNLVETLTSLEQYFFYRYNFIIFIIISNINSENINNVVYRNAENGNQKRLELADFNPEFNENGPNGWFFKLHKQGLIDAVIPFFPLHKANVLHCIKTELSNHHQITNEDLALKILEDIPFDSTKALNNEYSKTGCKKVSDKIYLWMNKAN